ncbi:MAG: hypothetical protein INF88_19940 [Roseomonas sp.]|nr:hypothetical protein [Roseomonas sp.]
MRRAMLSCLLMLTLLLPAFASAQPAPPVWGRTTNTFTDSFNDAAKKQRLRYNIPSVICAMGNTIECDAPTGFLPLKLRASNNPEALREVAIPYTGNTPMVQVIGMTHMVLEALEPRINEQERRNAVLGMFGIGNAPKNDTPQVGQTRMRIRDFFRGGEVQFQFVPQP